jgi:hypothetical protein
MAVTAWWRSESTMTGTCFRGPQHLRAMSRYARKPMPATSEPNGYALQVLALHQCAQACKPPCFRFATMFSLCLVVIQGIYWMKKEAA